MKKLLQILSVLILIGGTSMTSAQFLDDAFWASTPSDEEIIERVYGGDGSYTNSRNTNVCTTGAMTVTTVAAGTILNSQTFNNNTIYVLETGIHTLSAGIYVYGQCIALVAKPNTTVHTSTQTSELINIWGAATNIILDGFTIDGDDNGIGGTHAYDSYGLKLVTSAGSVLSNSFNNLTIRNNEYAVEIFGQSPTNTAEYNIFTNNTFIDNTYGVSIVEPGGTTGTTIGTILSGNEFIGNETGVVGTGTNTIIDNNLYSGNTNPGNTGTNAGGSDVMTTITEPTTCSDPDGCICYGTEINNGDQCTDGSRTTVSNGASCNDPNGCVCGTNNINNGATCTIASSGGGGGGGSSVTIDDCPDGDFTDSYYDGSCGVPSSNGELALGGVIDDDTYSSFGTIAKAHLLANEYAALVEQGVTELRHGVFFSIIATYAEMQNRSDSKVDIIIGALIDVFSKMSETMLAKYGFDKTIFLQELERLKA